MALTVIWRQFPLTTSPFFTSGSEKSLTRLSHSQIPLYLLLKLFGNLFNKTAMKNKGTFFQIFFHLKIYFFLE
jgi:hypothetical protein